jgi:enoyl-CoA hydratase/carnithine racemase
MTNYTDIAVTLDGHILTVEIQRPPHNFFDHSLIGQIADAFAAADDNPECRAIVLAAEGKHFCAGANFGSGKDDDSGSRDFTEEGFRNTTGKLYREAARLFGNSKPVVGAIQGAAIGGGLGLALVPDFRVACPEARFAANFVKLGIHQGFGISVTLPRVVGQQAAAMMLLTGRRVGGEEAHAMGLVDVLTSQDKLRDEACALAREIAENAPLAVQGTKVALNYSDEHSVEEGLDHVAQWNAARLRSNDVREAVTAFIEKRKPKFSGS